MPNFTGKALAGLLFIVFIIVLFTVPALAQEAAGAESAGLTAEQYGEARTIEAFLRCPVCEGQSVLESNSEVASEMKVKIREMLAAGRTRQEILDYFVNEYGDWILNTPPARGAGLVAWIAPFIFLVAGGLILFVMLRRWGRGTDGGDQAAKLPPGPRGGPGEGPGGFNPETQRRINERLRDYV